MMVFYIDYIILLLQNFEQCDPKKCTGVKLMKYGILKEINVTSKFQGLLLTPEGKQTCIKLDAQLIRERGICVIDCSWAQFSELKINLTHVETRSRINYVYYLNSLSSSSSSGSKSSKLRKGI